VREGEELKAPRHVSAAATRDGNLPSRDGNLPYLTAICLIPDNYSYTEVNKEYFIKLYPIAHTKVFTTKTIYSA
jgi:hypothetical protein